MQQDQIQTESTSVAPAPAVAAGQVPTLPADSVGNMWMNPALFNHVQRVGNLLAHSSMVPDHFQGNASNCVIALELSTRMDINVFALMQKMYVVHGKPGLEAQLLIAMANKSGVFADRITWSFSGTKGKDDWTCTAHATDAKTGEHYEMSIDWTTVKKEGWLEKKGSKWKTIPEMMFRYRTASWLIKSYAPEVAMGFQTADELDDMTIDITPRGEDAGHALSDQGYEPASYDLFFQAHPEAKEDKELIREFVAATAKAFEDTEASVLARALDQPEGFLGQFETWKANQAEKPPEAEPAPEDDLEAEAREVEMKDAKEWEKDGEQAPAPDEETIGNGALRGLEKALEDTGANMTEFLDTFGVKSVADLPKSKHTEALRWVKQLTGGK